MKKILQRIAVALYAWTGGGEQTLAQFALDAVPPERDFTEGLSAGQRVKFFADIAQLKANTPFIHVLSFLTEAQVQAIARHATPETLSFARGTLNGIRVVLDEINRMEARYVKEQSAPPFDPLSTL